jgi:hypothetical protein
MQKPPLFNLDSKYKLSSLTIDFILLFFIGFEKKAGSVATPHPLS